jgi:hypothetical protein
MIAQRTKEALAVARRRLAKQGRRLGNPNGAKALRKGNSAAVATIKEITDRRADDLRDVLADIVESGAVSLAEIAAKLNAREIEAPRGGRWYPTSVARLRHRAGELETPESL